MAVIVSPVSWWNEILGMRPCDQTAIQARKVKKEFRFEVVLTEPGLKC